MKKIIDQGIELGQFDVKQSERFYTMWQILIQGVEATRLRDNFIDVGISKSRFATDIIEYLIIGLKK